MIGSLPLLAFSRLVLAVDEATQPVTRPPLGKAPFSSGSPAQDSLAMTSLWQLTLGMLLVLGLILAIAWLRILGGLSMGSRERVVLIQVGETQLLLGVAPGRVQTLHVLEQSLQPPSVVGSGFADHLGRLLGKDKKR
jgi:flagellar protein FliO/FliZ